MPRNYTLTFGKDLTYTLPGIADYNIPESTVYALRETASLDFVTINLTHMKINTNLIGANFPTSILY
jgi:hypothetical protein